MLAHEFLSPKDREQISSAISAIEAKTTAELRVHIETKCPSKDPLKRAQELFKKLGMHKTQERNGVLIYIATESRNFAIFGDQGIHEKVSANYWQQEKDLLLKAFINEEYVSGLIQCIEDIGAKLALYFPGQINDRNELTNEVSFGD